VTVIGRVLRVQAMVLGLALLASGCTQIPSSGEVQAVDPQALVSDDDVDFLPPGPSTGASPSDILQGFVAAGAAAQNNYRVARSFLTEEFADQWNPNQSVLIRQGESRIIDQGSAGLVYEAQIIASVDDSGRYEAAASPTTQALEFRLEQRNGQWRIADAPDGIILTDTSFGEAFESYQLYYYSADYRELVPDLRWFASRGDVLTKVIRGLLDEPSYWLGGGVTASAFPPGTQLVLSPVPVVDGQAQVDVNEAVVDANATQRERMLLQLTTTLSQISGVSDAVITHNQTPVRIVTTGENQPVLTSGRDPRSLVVRGLDFGYLQAGRIDSIEGLERAILSLRPEKVFFNQSLQQAAVLGELGVWRVTESGASEEPWDVREELVRPLIDSCGFTWSMTKAPGEDALRVFPRVVVDPETNVTVLPVDLPVESSVVTMEIARDNTRLLLLVQTDQGVRVLLAGIVRGPDCEPLGLGEFVELSPLANEAVDAAFVDDTQVAIVTRDDQAGEVVIQDVNGRVTSAGRPGAPQTLVAGVGGVSGLRLLTDQGTILQPRGNGWQSTGERANVLVTQR